MINETPDPTEEISLADLQAIALAYEKGVQVAPHVVAKGKGYMARQIIELAREHGVEIRKDANLASLLSAVELDAPIPIEAYAAVAEILSYLYRKNATKGN